MSKYPKLYHGTSFRALEMTAEERAQMRKDCHAMIESLCEYFMPIFSAGKITDMMVPLNYYKDQRIFHNLCNALKIISAEKNGNKQYDLGDFYVTTAEYKAVSYARSSFAFGETGLRAYRFVVAAKKLGIYEDLDGTIKQYADFVYRFGETKEEPVGCTLLDITPSMLLTETGKEVTEDNIMQHQSFRLKVDYELSPTTAMPTWLFARMCDKTKWPPCYR